jgi:sporulation protein YlmC with PRC-barrel domain
MTATTTFKIGAEAHCNDGPCGQIRCVVVDPVAQAVTHLVVESKHRQGLGRLVPLNLIAAVGDELSLNCDRAAFENLEMAEEVQFMPGSIGYATYKPKDTLTLPYYGLGLREAAAAERAAQSVTLDRLPVGEVSIHRGDRVHATDGEIGVVKGLTIDRRNHHVTHVLLQEGHLWGRKNIAIPIGTVTSLGKGVQLSICKADIQDLPSVDLNELNE